MQRSYEFLKEGTVGQRLKFLANDTFYYGIASAISSFLAIFKVPILTRCFGAHDYGVIDILAVWEGIFVLFIIMGLDSGLARYYYEVDTPENRKRVVSQALFCQLGACIIMTAGVFFFASQFSTSIIHVPKRLDVVQLLALCFPGVFLVQFSRNLLKWILARNRFIFISLGSSASVILLTIFFVMILKMDIKGVFLAEFIGMTIFGIIGLIFCRHLISIPRDIEFIGPMFRFCLPYFAIGIMAAFVPAIDRYFVSTMLNFEMLGFYAVGYKLASIIRLPISAFQIAWNPLALSIYKSSNSSQTYRSVLLLYTACMCILAFMVCACAQPLIIILASSSYLRGLPVVLPLIFSVIIESIGCMLGFGIDLSKKTYFSVISYIVGLLVTVACVILLIPLFGIAGAALGILIGNIVKAGCYFIFGHKVYFLKLPLMQPVIMLFISIFMLAIVNYGAYRSPLMGWLFAGGMFPLLLLFFWKIGISTYERNLLKTGIRQLRKGNKLSPIIPHD